MRHYVLKFELHPTEGAVHAIPEGSFFLDLQVQLGRPVMWWSVPAVEQGSESSWPLRTFGIATTGPPGYDSDRHYVGTFQLGGFVGHVLSLEPVPRTLDEAYAEATNAEVA
jgi:hypothetical protein